MDNKKEKIIVLILTWAALLVAVLYSPIGSPELYSPKRVYYKNQGEIFDAIQISNTPLRIQNFVNRSQTLFISTSEPERNYSSNTAVNSGPFYFKQESSINSFFNQTESWQDKKNGTVPGDRFIVSTSMGNSSNRNTLQENNGVIYVTSDLMIIDNYMTNKQAIDYAPNNGGTNPGEDPIGNPIRVGDGWIYLLLLALVYTVWKVLKPKLL